MHIGRNGLAGSAFIVALMAAPAIAHAAEGRRVPVIAVPVPNRADVDIAVLPLENLAGLTTPSGEIRSALMEKLEERWIPALDESTLDDFMRRNRMRYTGGLSGEMGQAFEAQTGASGVLVTTVDLFDMTITSAVALTARLVSTGSETRILWMDSAAASGDEEPGFLRLGEVKDPAILIDRVTGRLADSLAGYLTGTAEPAGPRGRGPRRFRPVKFYRSSGAAVAAGQRPRVAVLPFSNGSAMRGAGEILTLQVVRFLAAAGDVEVIEPGVVRQTLLRSRFIQHQGPSIPQSDLLRALLNVDIVLFGEVEDYREAAPGVSEPVVDFSARAIDTASRQVIWSSVSYGRGGDGVFFFDVGRVPTAQQLAGEMARGLIGAILAPVEGAS